MTDGSFFPSVYFSEDAIEAASTSDRNWFRNNPHRKFRLRPMIPDELPVVMTAQRGSWFVAVSCVANGVRMRQAVFLEKQPANTEEIASQVFVLSLREAKGFA